MSGSFGISIRHRAFIASPISRVFETIASARGWDAFFTTGMTLQPCEGGEIVFRWINWGADGIQTSAQGRIIRYTPPSSMAFQWFPINPGQPTTIVFELSEVEGGTIVQVTEDGYPDTIEGRTAILDCACGWGEAVTLLKMYLEHGVQYTRRPLES